METLEVISHLTALEAVHLRATLHAIDDERFQCGKCKPSQREAKWCEKLSPNVHWEIDSDLRFRKCPGNYYSQVALNWLEMQQAFELGVMPYPGSLADQPNKIIEAFRVISDYRRKQADNARRKAESEALRRKLSGR